MAIAGMSEKNRLEMTRSTLEEMETLAARLRELIAAQSPRDLLGYIYGQRMLGALRDINPVTDNQNDKPETQGDLINDTQFVLDYVHATLASTSERGDATLDEGACAEIFECATKLKTATMLYAMASSAGTEDGAFGPDTADMEFKAKSTWIQLRGNRYQVLEGEFYAFALAAQDDLLRETYGMGASGIAAGFQDMADAVRAGLANAAEEMARQHEAALAIADAQSRTLTEVMAD